MLSILAGAVLCACQGTEAGRVPASENTEQQSAWAEAEPEGRGTASFLGAYNQVFAGAADSEGRGVSNVLF